MRALSLAFLLVTGTGQAHAAEQVPEFPDRPASAWINSAPLSLSELRGRAVLIEFWTFGCSNCRNTLPWLALMHEKYAPAGLAIVAVHSPEFDRERDPAAVRRAVERLGIRYPVMLDNDFAYWRAMGNRYWPAFYLVGPDGRLIDTRIGELHSGRRSADEFERRIATAVREATGH